MAHSRLDTRGGTSRSQPRDVPDRDASLCATDDPAMAEPTRTRTPSGRFAKGASGNARGRPPKPKPSPDTILAQILDEEVPNNVPGQPSRISVREALVRSLCMRGFKDPRIALTLLKLDAVIRQTAKPDAAGETNALLVQEEEALKAYFAREWRRLQRTQDEEGAS